MHDEKHPQPRIEFKTDAKLELKSKLLSEICRTNHPIINCRPDKNRRESEINYFADEFVSQLEGQADYFYKQKWLYEHQKTQDRDRAIESIGKSLERIIEDYLKLDADTKIHVFSECVRSLSDFYGLENQCPNSLETDYLIYENEAWLAVELKIIAKSMMETASRMPPVEYKKLILSVAESILLIFIRQGLKYSKSETGFTAYCFKSVLELAEIQWTSTLSNWLRQAEELESIKYNPFAPL